MVGQGRKRNEEANEGKEHEGWIRLDLERVSLWRMRKKIRRKKKGGK